MRIIMKYSQLSSTIPVIDEKMYKLWHNRPVLFHNTIFFFLNKLPNYPWPDKTQQIQKHKQEEDRDFSFLK